MLLPDHERLIIPESSGDVVMMTANRRYWTDPVYRRNVNEFMRYFQSLESEVTQFIAERGCDNISMDLLD